jgi:hypothetical protein
VAADQSYAGYGLPDARPLPQVFPSGSLAQAIRDAQKVLEGTLFTTDFAAWQRPPYKSVYFTDYRRTILNIDAGVNAAANAAGLALNAAETTFAPLNPVMRTTVGAGLLQFGTLANALWSRVPNDSLVMVIESWGIECVNAPPEALAVRLIGNPLGGLGSGGGNAPNPAVSSSQASDHQRTKLIVAPNQALAVQIGNVTNMTPLFVKFSVSGWVFPVTRFVDKKEQMQVRPGYGVECDRPGYGVECDR